MTRVGYMRPQGGGGGDPDRRVDLPDRQGPTRARVRRHGARGRTRYDELERSNRTYQTALRLLLHDTWLPLTRIRVSLEALSENESWDPAVSIARLVEDLDGVEDVLSAVAEMERLPGRTERGQLEDTDLSTLIRGIIHEVDHGTHTIEPDIERRSAVLEPTLVRLALTNLIRNALTHTPIGCTVWIRARGTVDELVFTVEDDGPGIAPEHRDEIFEAFQRANAPDSTPGIGLGLAIVRGIAEGLDGDVSVGERAGGGASLRLVVPLPRSS